MSTLPRIGVVGTGRMGANMARRLKDVGYPIVALYDVHPEAAQATARDTGGEATQSLPRVTELSDVIITVVSDDSAMRNIFAERGALLDGAKGTYLHKLRDAHAASCMWTSNGLRRRRERHALEACMASSIPQARQGTLYLMIGGRREVFERVKPMLEEMSSSLKYIGEAGRAAQVKALVNMVMNINTAGLAEGLGLGERAWARSRHAARSLFADRREFARTRNRRRRHAGARTRRATSRPNTQRRIPASRSRSRATPISGFRSRKQPTNSSS